MLLVLENSERESTRLQSLQINVFNIHEIQYMNLKHNDLFYVVYSEIHNFRFTLKSSNLELLT